MAIATPSARRVPTVVSFFDLNPCKFGSMEEYAALLSEALNRRGWRSVLLFTAEGDPGVRKHLEQYHGVVQTVRAGTTGHLGRGVLRQIRRHRPDVIHFHFAEQFSLLPIRAGLTGARSIFFTDHVRTPEPLKRLTRWKLRVWNAIIPRLIRLQVLTPSDHVRSVLVERFSMREQDVKVMYNGINLARFVPLMGSQKGSIRRELGMPAERKIVVCVAALVPEKGVGCLLQAASDVLRMHRDTEFVIVGDGPLLPALQQQVRALGIAEHVRFTGLRSDVHKILGVADVACLPSVWSEPAGLVTLESMACACPVVATRTGGIPEHVTERTALLVDPGASDQLASAISSLLADPARAAAMGRAGRQWVEERFSMEAWVERTIQMYESALALKAEVAQAAMG